jgi:hypothetical protein
MANVIPTHVSMTGVEVTDQSQILRTPSKKHVSPHDSVHTDARKEESGKV